MTKLFSKLKKSCFRPIFPTFLGEKNLSQENLNMSCTTSFRFLAPCQTLQKTDNTIPRKYLDKQKDGRTDGRMDRTHFIGPFQPPLGVEKNLNTFYHKKHLLYKMNGRHHMSILDSIFIKKCQENIHTESHFSWFTTLLEIIGSPYLFHRCS